MQHSSRTLGKLRLIASTRTGPHGLILVEHKSRIAGDLLHNELLLVRNMPRNGNVRNDRNGGNRRDGGRGDRDDAGGNNDRRQGGAARGAGPQANRDGAQRRDPTGHVPAARLLQDYREQNECPCCMAELSTFCWNKPGGPALPVTGYSTHHGVFVDPCGHWVCVGCRARMVIAVQLGSEGFAEHLRLERCGLCRGVTNYVCRLTQEQRDEVRFNIALDAADPLDENGVPLADAARIARAAIAPPAASDDSIQRLANVALMATTPTATPANVAALAHRVRASCPVTFNSIQCLGVLPAPTHLRGAGLDANGTMNSYHASGGYVNLVDNTSIPHRVMHLQSRLILKYVIEVVSALSTAVTTGNRILLVDVGGRPDVVHTIPHFQACGVSVAHMCPIIMQEDMDREDEIEKYVSGEFAGYACRCALGSPGVQGIGYDTSGCIVCNPDHFSRRMAISSDAEDPSLLPQTIYPEVKTRRIFYLSHVYELSVNQLCSLAQSGDVLFAAHSFDGFSGKFEFSRGGTADVLEAKWERMGDKVTMAVEGGYDYAHDSHNFLRQTRALNCGGFGCFKWSRVFTVGDLSLNADPMLPTKMGTTLWHLSKCDPSVVPVVDLGNFARRNAAKVVTLAGTTYRITRDNKEVQIIAEGEMNDSATISWECFDMVARNFVAQSPGTANTYARSRAIVMPHIPSDKATLVLCAARAYMRPALLAYAASVNADRLTAERIDGSLRGTPRVTQHLDIMFGAVIGGAATGRIVGALLGGAAGAWAVGEARDIRNEGLRVYMQRNNINPVHAMLGGAVLMAGVNSCSVGLNQSIVTALGSFPNMRDLSMPRMPTFDGLRSIFTSVNPPEKATGIEENAAWVGNLIVDYWSRDVDPEECVGFADALTRSARAAANKLDVQLGVLARTVISSFGGSEVAFGDKNTVAYKQYALVGVGLCIFAHLVNKRRRDRRPRNVFTGQMFDDTFSPANLRPMCFYDALRRCGYAAVRLALHYVSPLAAQAGLFAAVSLDSVESRWLQVVVTSVSFEEVVKQFSQHVYSTIVTAYDTPAVLNMHCVFAGFEFLQKIIGLVNAGVFGREFWIPIIGATMAVCMHVSIRNMPYARRELIHVIWNLAMAWVSVGRGMRAARGEVGRYVHDLGGGMYDNVSFGNVLAGQAFLYDMDYVRPEMRDDAKITEPDPYRYVPPKPKGLLVCGPILDPTVKQFCAPVAYTYANEIRAVMSRITKVTPSVDVEFFNSVFRPMAMKIANKIFLDARVFPMKRDDWLSTLPLRRRTMLTTAFADIDADPWLLKYNSIGGKVSDPTKRKLFLKVEQTKYNADGRAIQAGLDTTLANAGPWCMALCKLLRDVGDGETDYEGVRIIFGIGRDKTTCFRLFFERSEQGLSVVMVTGDDVLVSDGRRMYSIDAKRWDAHTGEELLALGNEVWDMLGIPKTVLENMTQGIKRNGRTVFGIFYSRIGGTASGDPDTIQKNCLLGMMILLVTFILRNIGSGFAAELDKIARKVGVVYEFIDESGVVIGDNANYHTLEFCSSIPVLLVGGFYGASPKIGKVLFRAGLAKPGHPPEVTLRSKALSLLAEARHSHTLTYYAMAAYDCVGGGRYFVEERRFTEYATTLDMDACAREEDAMLQRRYGCTLAEIKVAIDRIWFNAVAGEIVFNDPLLAHIIEVDA